MSKTGLSDYAMKELQQRGIADGIDVIYFRESVGGQLGNSRSAYKWKHQRNKMEAFSKHSRRVLVEMVGQGSSLPSLDDLIAEMMRLAPDDTVKDYFRIAVKGPDLVALLDKGQALGDTDCDVLINRATGIAMLSSYYLA